MVILLPFSARRVKVTPWRVSAGNNMVSTPMRRIWCSRTSATNSEHSELKIHVEVRYVCDRCGEMYSNTRLISGRYAIDLVF